MGTGYDASLVIKPRGRLLRCMNSARGTERRWSVVGFRRVADVEDIRLAKHATLLIGVTGRDATWRTGHGPGGARPSAAAEHK